MSMEEPMEMNATELPLGSCQTWNPVTVRQAGVRVREGRVKLTVPPTAKS